MHNILTCSYSDSFRKDEFQNSSFQFILRSPAKVNLFFRVLSKRTDNFHEIASLYQAIGLCDTLYFQLDRPYSFSCYDSVLTMDHTNLVVRAADLFFARTGIQKQGFIGLKKVIPMQAGLGGGSSNAATVLWGLNELFERPASLKNLIEWSAELGSDVAFFLSSGTAYCTGKGEILQEVVLPVSRSPITIVKPSYGLSTPLVYQNMHLDQLTQRSPLDTLSQFLQGFPVYYNDLEVPSFFLLPSLKQMKDMLRSAGFSQVLMCGSGTAFFCLGDADISHLNIGDVYRTSFVNRLENRWY
jgi:4-diphosphocytidyl-2-C-methyl-D-erythritol kinase